MSTNSRRYQLHAELVDTGLGKQVADAVAMAKRLERSLNRMERVASVYLGQVTNRLGNSLQVAFETAEAAVLGACEMQRRYGALPQVSGTRVFLNIGIHEGIALRRAKEVTGSAIEIAALLAEVSDGIVASGAVIEVLTPELRTLARPCKGPYPEISAHEIDWRREIPTTAYGGVSIAASGIYLLLRHKLKILELTRDKPVLTVGRDQLNDLILSGSHVSRQHCRIERQADRIVLADTSSNGSFVTPDGGKERCVQNSFVVLKGKGFVFFGRESRGERRGGARYEIVA